MGRTFRCKHCGKIVAYNPRIKTGQRYCGLSTCQLARKNAWRRDKKQKDADYRRKCRASNKQWRKHHRAHLYYQKYRETHPEYVTKNRQQQQKRNNKRRAVQQSTKIVKSDALQSKRLINSGFYALSPCKENNMGKIVKSDALMVQLSVLQINAPNSIEWTTRL